MKKLKFLWLVLSILSIGLTACDDDDDTVFVKFDTLTANGSVTSTTTVLTLTFDHDVDGLNAGDITLTAGETGVVKGALTAKGSGTYELAVSGITAGGEVTVAVSKTGYNISPSSKTVNVFYVPPATAVAFTSLTANGSATSTTTVLTLTFDQDVDGLSADDITLTAGETGAVKGALTSKGSGAYELELNDITAGGEVTVSVEKEGYAFTPETQTVEIFKRTDKYLKITDIPSAQFDKTNSILVTFENTSQGGDNVAGYITPTPVTFSSSTFESMLTGGNNKPFTQSGTLYIRVISGGLSQAVFEANFDTDLIEVSWNDKL